MNRLLALLIVLGPLPAFAENNLFGLGGFYGLSTGGVVQVRENALIGDRLDLQDDLGLDSFTGLSLVYGRKLGAGWLDFAYTQYFLTGKAQAPSTFNFNGALYAPGETDISRTNYRRATILYRHLSSGARESLSRTMWGGGIVVETLKFYIGGQLDASTQRNEKFESFDAQTMPVPALTAEWYRPLFGNLGFGFEGLIGYLPLTKTPYKEKGNIYFKQTNAEFKAALTSDWGGTLLETGYYFKYFMQMGNSREDTNEFFIFTSAVFLDAKWFF